MKTKRRFQRQKEWEKKGKETKLEEKKRRETVRMTRVFYFFGSLCEQQWWGRQRRICRCCFLRRQVKENRTTVRPLLSMKFRAVTDSLCARWMHWQKHLWHRKWSELSKLRPNTNGREGSRSGYGFAFIPSHFIHFSFLFLHFFFSFFLRCLWM